MDDADFRKASFKMVGIQRKQMRSRNFEFALNRNYLYLS